MVNDVNNSEIQWDGFFKPKLPPVFSGVHVTRSLVLCVMFCRSLFVLLVSSNSSYLHVSRMRLHRIKLSTLFVKLYFFSRKKDFYIPINKSTYIDVSDVNY